MPKRKPDIWNHSRELINLFHLVLNNLTSGIVVLDRDLRIIYLNKAQEAWSGLKLEEVRGKSLIRLFPHLARDGSEMDLRAALQGKRVVRERVPYRKSDGSTGYSCRESIPLRDGRGRIIGVLSKIEEVTDKVILEKKLMWAQKFEDLGHLSAGLAHELNNLFTALMGQAQLARHTGRKIEKERAVQAALDVSRQGAEITRKLLNFSRNPDGPKEPADLKAIIEDSVSLLKGVLDYEKISIEAILEETPKIRINTSHIQQLIFNLILNAKNAMTAGGRLSLKLQKRPGRIRLSVSDNGPGIPPALLKNIFDPFVTYSHDRKKSGTGLGLSICRDIVKDHEGTIKVRSRCGRGTTFIVTLPAGERSGDN